METDILMAVLAVVGSCFLTVAVGAVLVAACMVLGASAPYISDFIGRLWRGIFGY